MKRSLFVLALGFMLSCGIAGTQRSRPPLQTTRDDSRSGTHVDDARLRLRLPAGDYRVDFFSPADGRPLGKSFTFEAPHLRKQAWLTLPSFTDDLAFRLVRTITRDQPAIPGTL